MVSIAITGHRPDSFLVSHYPIESVIRIVDDVITILQRKHEDLSFNLGGAIGIDQWVGNVCIEKNIPFTLFLPFHPDIQTKFWNEADKENLQKQMTFASGIDIIEPNPNAKFEVWKYQKRNEKMIDSSDFVVAFWVGKKKGGTTNAIKYALKKSKFVLNGLDGLNPIYNEDVKKGWTPK